MGLLSGSNMLVVVISTLNVSTGIVSTFAQSECSFPKWNKTRVLITSEPEQTYVLTHAKSKRMQFSERILTSLLTQQISTANTLSFILDPGEQK